MIDQNQTINTSKLTLADWKSIATATDNHASWAFHQWVRNNVDYEFSQLTMMDMAGLGQSVGLTLQQVCIAISTKLSNAGLDQ